MSDYLPICTIKHCNYLAESIKLYGLELCHKHQLVIGNWIQERKL